jgi:hypothetical protein
MNFIINLIVDIFVNVFIDLLFRNLCRFGIKIRPRLSVENILSRPVSIHRISSQADVNKLTSISRSREGTTTDIILHPFFV